MAEQLLNQMLEQINKITNSLDATLQKVNVMSENINKMTMSFSQEIVSLTENIRLIVEVLRQGRVKSAETLTKIAEDVNEKVKELWEKESVRQITEQHQNNINTIKQVSASVTDTLYYTQLLSVVQSIREIMGRALKGK